MAEELLGTEIGLAFIIIGILLFLVEATMPGFLIAVPATVLRPNHNPQALARQRMDYSRIDVT